MKRIILICLSLLLIASALTSCKPTGESPWEFEYKLEKGVFTQGDTIRVTVTVTNNGKDYRYTGSPTDLFGPAQLYSKYDVSYKLKTPPFVNTDDATERVFAKGQTAQYTYEFYTDEFSREGFYNLAVPFASETATFEMLLYLGAPPTEEELAVIELADAEILKKFPIGSLANYQVRIDKNAKGGYSVRYTLMIGNYRTNESYTVRVNEDRTVESIYGEYGEYAAYLPYATEDKIRAAEEKLTEQIEKYDESSGFYLTIDSEGYLCLHTEIIVKYENVFGGGCGIDHDHKFFTERICSLQ